MCPWNWLSLSLMAALGLVLSTWKAFVSLVIGLEWGRALSWWKRACSMSKFGPTRQSLAFSLQAFECLKVSSRSYCRSLCLKIDKNHATNIPKDSCHVFPCWFPSFECYWSWRWRMSPYYWPWPCLGFIIMMNPYFILTSSLLWLISKFEAFS